MRKEGVVDHLSSRARVKVKFRVLLVGAKSGAGIQRKKEEEGRSGDGGSLRKAGGAVRDV